MTKHFPIEPLRNSETPRLRDSVTLSGILVPRESSSASASASASFIDIYSNSLFRHQRFKSLLMLLTASVIMFVTHGVCLQSTSLLLLLDSVWRKVFIIGAFTSCIFNLLVHFTVLLQVYYGPQSIVCRNLKPRSEPLRALFSKSAIE